jgi:hypothetical protein
LILFFPLCGCEPAVLEEGVSDHRHQRMAVKAVPGSALEVIKTEFFLGLLVSLLANPPRLDGGRRTQDVRREEILSRQPAGEDRPAHPSAIA